jgi:hypothetical protein
VPSTSLVLSRPGRPFDEEEATVATAMAGVLSVSLRAAQQVELAGLAGAAEMDGEDVARQVAGLQERQHLLERFVGIQRAISHRAPIQSVFDAITDGTHRCSGRGRRAAPPRPGGQRLPAAGLLRRRAPDVAAAIRRTPVGEGGAGRPSPTTSS